MTVLHCYRGSTSCLDLVMGIVWARTRPLKVGKNFRPRRTKIFHFKPYTALDYKCHIFVGVVLNILQTSKYCFGTQTMPITRSKQLVEPLHRCGPSSWLCQDRKFSTYNRDFDEEWITPIGNSWAPTNSLYLVMGIVWARKLPLKVCKNFSSSRTKIFHFKP